MTKTELREKLVELLKNHPCNSKMCAYCKEMETCNFYEKSADHLIAHGVTINVPQKPIGHKVEHAPVKIGRGIWSKGTTVYTCPKCGILISKIYDYCAKCGQHIDWSNLPEPPKEE